MQKKTSSNKLTTGGWMSLGIAVVVIAAVWLGLLPQLATSKTITERNESMERRGIDPAAMFYTDHDSAFR